MSKGSLIEIEPKELKFIFEFKKQSSCAVQLTNNTRHYVAFKVKTTSPKKYSVRPNVGVLLPHSTCEFIVTMQAQRVAPADMECKDKFLIQSTVVSADTTSEDVTSSLFVKDGSRVIEENKLKVALISPPDSPEFSPMNGDFKNGLDYSKDEIQSPEAMILRKQEHGMVNEVSKLEEDQELKPEHDIVGNTLKGVEMPKEAVLKVSKAGELNTAKDVEELKPDKEAELKVSNALDLKTVENVEELKLDKGAEFKVSGDQELKVLKISKAGELNTVKDVEELRPDKEAELKVSKAKDLNTVKNVEELKLETRAQLLPKDLDLNKVKNVEELKPKKEAELKVSEDQELKAVKDVEELKPEKVGLKVSKDLELETVKNVEELKSEKEADSKILKGVEELKLMEAIEDMKLKLDVLESKLNEAGVTISMLTEERRLSNQETKILQDKLADFIKKSPRNIQVGFPLLYVCMVALICVFLGYRLHC